MRSYGGGGCRRVDRVRRMKDPGFSPGSGRTGIGRAGTRPARGIKYCPGPQRPGPGTYPTMGSRCSVTGGVVFPLGRRTARMAPDRDEPTSERVNHGGNRDGRQATGGDHDGAIRLVSERR